MFRVALACALFAGCGDELASTELPACGQFRDGHWDTRLVSPGVAGLSSSVAAIKRMPDGSLIAAGHFSAMSGVAARNIARWDGSAWTPLANGLPGQVTSIAIDDQGRLWAVGDSFNVRKPIGEPESSPGSYLARWSGAEWTYVVQSAFTIYGVTAVDGGVAVFGNFFAQPDLPANTVAIWRDGVWSSTGLVAGGSITVGVRDRTGLCVSGNLQTNVKEFLFGVICWDGTRWQQLGENTISSVSTLARDDDGRWYAGGFVQLFEDGNDRYGIARLDDDGMWRSLDGGVFPKDAVAGGGALFQPEVTSISVDGDDIVIAGRFEWVGIPKQRAYHLARWNPTTGWSSMTPPSDLFGRLSTVLSADGHTYVGGAFQRIGLQPGAGIATVDGGTVHSLPATTLAATRVGAISDMIALPDGLLLAGQFKDVNDLGNPDAPKQSLLRFDGEWGRPIEGVPVNNSMTAVALDDGYAVRAGDKLYRRYDQRQWHLVTNESVQGPMVADGNGKLFFVVPTVPQSTIVQTTRDDTSFYAFVPGTVVAMAIYDGELVVVTTNDVLGGQSVYRRRDDEWELIGAWSDFTYSLVTSPTLGLVAGTSNGTRVWNGREWRTVSRAVVYDMAACSDGVVAAIDEGDGTRLSFLDDPDEEWTYFGEPRGGQWWQITPTARGIYIGSAFANEGGVGIDSPLGLARWTTLDDAGW
jgi:hypothetical protein